jgi:hypothetical protein
MWIFGRSVNNEKCSKLDFLPSWIFSDFSSLSTYFSHTGSWFWVVLNSEKLLASGACLSVTLWPCVTPRVAAVGGSLQTCVRRYKCRRVPIAPLSEVAPEVAGLKPHAPPPLSECTTLPHLTFAGEPRTTTIPELPLSVGVPTMPVRSPPSPLCGLRRAPPPAMPRIVSSPWTHRSIIVSRCEVAAPVYLDATGPLSPSTACAGENPISPSHAEQHLPYTAFFLSSFLEACRGLSERCTTVRRRGRPG